MPRSKLLNAFDDDMIAELENGQPMPTVGEIELPYEITIVTPMFGGGTVAGQPDNAHPVSEKSIRGHLRFWWRATCGARYKTVADLAWNEAELFGDTKFPSRVDVSLSDVRFPIPRACGAYKQRVGDSIKYDFNADQALAECWDDVAYVLFPFVGKSPGLGIDEPSRFFPPGGKFKLRLRVRRDKRITTVLNARRLSEAARRVKAGEPILEPASADVLLDLQCAVWAWVNFGGIGARTRRGCGTLMSPTLSPPESVRQSAKGILDYFAGVLTTYGVTYPVPVRAWPTLGQFLFDVRRQWTPVTAWQSAVRPLREFRQSDGIARKPGTQGRPGRSRWPEADTIRRLTGVHLNSPEKTHDPATGVTIDAFPRAEFGLPIIFHFKDSDRGGLMLKDKDPADTTLEPLMSSRMASPFIIKPLVFSDGQTAVPCIVRMQAPEIQHVQLKSGKSPITSSSVVPVREPVLAKDPDSPIGGVPNPRSAAGSAAEAFWKFAQQKFAPGKHP